MLLDVARLTELQGRVLTLTLTAGVLAVIKDTVVPLVEGIEDFKLTVERDATSLLADVRSGCVYGAPLLTSEICRITRAYDRVV